MTDLRKAAQMALDALERYEDGQQVYFDEEIEALRARLAQPERKWQGLTDEEIMDACSAVWASHPIEVGRVVEEKLKEKNT